MKAMAGLCRLARLLCIFLLLLTKASAEQEAGYSRFSFDASMFPTEAEYDYIVVGGGTAGCPLAATLSQEYRVLLLERGGVPQEFPNLMSQEGFLATLVETDAYNSPAQAFISEEGVPNARGRVLGGSSAINAGFYSRAEPEFFMEGGGGGPIRWDMEMVNQSYEWVERAVTFRPLLRGWQSAIRDSLLEANVTPYNDFTVLHLHGTKIGASTFDPSGRRRSAADLLAFAREENIQVAVRATAEKILLKPLSPTSATSSSAGKVAERAAAGEKSKKQRAIGVVYRDQFGMRHRATTRAGGEVILSAGALGSPQLLLLSGVGPRGHLQSMGIAVARHHPHIGKFVYDNPRNGISIAPPAPLEHSLIQVVGITDSGAFLEAASTSLVAAVRHRRHRHGEGSGAAVGGLAPPGLAGRPRQPRVRFNYFSDGGDLERCVEGLRKIGDLLEAQSMEEFKLRRWLPLEEALQGGGAAGRDFRFVGPALPVNRSDGAAMEEFCRRTVTTIWHYHGGCVTGVSSLRVVDGSVLSAYLGQRMILERRKKRSRLNTRPSATLTPSQDLMNPPSMDVEN
ncbi:unnamed protein product [Spirodela intermedia]|uniref:Glucose-methanol-choline oxidoreductase N-terminal domain-containing protein n=1 Tax=Spirodela intermedia TaxID=51605 RepID=A0A7I8JLG1_SPIIN|nr:unnamed protein product [Spirodela intermedia]CAA6670312.1 unnamed protein product [Spirodela intermedia]